MPLKPGSNKNRTAPPPMSPSKLGPVSGQTGYGGVAQLGLNKAMHGPTSPHARPGPMHGPARPGPMHGPAMPGPVHGPPKPIAQPAPVGKRMSGRTKTGLMIGGAAAVGVALNNRSGRPTDRGRQSTYRY